MRVTLFTSENCAGCGATKDLLQMLKVPFSEIAAEGNRAIFDCQGIESLPTLVISKDGKEERIIGFAPKRIKEALSGVNHH